MAVSYTHLRMVGIINRSNITAYAVAAYLGETANWQMRQLLRDVVSYCD